MHRRFSVGRDGKTAYERSVGWRAVPPLGQFGELVRWMPLQPCNGPLGPLDSRFERGRYLGPLDGSNTVLVGTASGVVKARTIKRLPPGERWTGSLLDEAQGSELTPNALEDDGDRIGIRAPVLQPHVAVPLPPLVHAFRQVRRAPLRRTDFVQDVPTPELVENKRLITQNGVVPEWKHSWTRPLKDTWDWSGLRSALPNLLKSRVCWNIRARDIALRAKGSSLQRH